MTTIYIAVLLSLVHHGGGHSTIVASSKAQCDSIVEQWVTQPKRANPYNSFIAIKFDGYCKTMEVER